LTTQQQEQRGLARIILGRYAEYTKSLAPIFLLCGLLFAFSLAMGYVLGENMSGAALQDVLGAFPDISNMSLIELFGFVAANNTFKSLLFMLGGLLGGVLPLFFVVFNGFLIGWIASSFSSSVGLGYVVAGLMPHGLFEIPAILLAMSMGVSLGYAALNSLKGSGSLWGEARTALGFFLTRVLPLLVLAAVIEVTITPFIMTLFGYI
jgi:stage II sporulation protein M